jgi:hypothetical protein
LMELSVEHLFSVFHQLEDEETFSCHRRASIGKEIKLIFC